MAERLVRSCELVRIEVVWVAEQHIAGRSGAFALPASAGAGACAPLQRRWLALAAGTEAPALAHEPALADLAARLHDGTLTMAIYGRAVRENTPLREGDRVELLGPISADPKLARRQRVARARRELPHGKWRAG